MVFSFPFSTVFGAPVTTVVTAAEQAALGGKALPIAHDILLEKETNDLQLSGGDLVLVADFGAIEQEIAIRLAFVFGEWFLDTTAGLPYFDNILVKSPNLAAIRTIFMDEILASAGVKGVLSLSLDFDRQERSLTVTFSVNTDLGKLESTLVR